MFIFSYEVTIVKLNKAYQDAAYSVSEQVYYSVLEHMKCFPPVKKAALVFSIVDKLHLLIDPVFRA